MKAVIQDRYGPAETLRVAEVRRPIPKDDEVLIGVRATTVNRTDTGFPRGRPLVGRVYAGLLRPRWRILGTEVAGVVVSVGAAVREFQAGDEVFGVNAGRFGAHAEFVCMREGAPLEHKPDGATFEHAAAVCDGAILALNPLRAAGVSSGQRILIYGASGSIGTAAVQLSKHFGAEVTAVCSTDNLELAGSLGADEVIDYTREDFTATGELYDVIFDAVGKHSFRRCRRSIRPHGAYLATDQFRNIALAALTARTGKRVVFPIPPRHAKQDVLFLKGLIEQRRYRAVIDRCYPLEQVVEATRYVESGQKVGNVVLTV